MFYIFYSWQSDTVFKDNRSFIYKILKKIQRRLNPQLGIEIVQATDRELGSVDISQSIFSHIDRADIFICDITCMYEYKSKKSPNPNVFLELGYAGAKIGWDRVICIINKKFSRFDDLPFDVRNRRIIEYDSSDEKDILEKNLEKIIKDSVDNLGNTIHIQIEDYLGNNHLKKPTIEEVIEAFPINANTPGPNEFCNLNFKQQYIVAHAIYKKNREWFDNYQELEDFYSGQTEQYDSTIEDAIKEYCVHYSLRYFDVYIENKSNKLTNGMFIIKVGKLDSCIKICSVEFLKKYDIDIQDVNHFRKNEEHIVIIRKETNIFPQERIKIARVYFSCNKNKDIYISINATLENGYKKEYSLRKKIIVNEIKFDVMDFYNS